jgi:hypothetical protein
MTTLGQVQDTFKQYQRWIAIGGVVVLLSMAMIMPELHRARMYEPLAQTDSFAQARAIHQHLATEQKVSAALVSPASPSKFAEQKMIRTTQMTMVVQHPAETADEITALAEKLGGYLVSAEGGGQDAIRGTLTIRVPAGRFEEARAEIRKLGLRVEAEKVDAEDVTQRYVDQNASLRNLRAEEAQFLAILKQASTVKDMLLVSERLSEVRGEIEQQQAEFDALSRQVETVAMTISLHKEVEAQVFGLNWRPLYQLRLALQDGLDSVGNYAAAMITILFYLPAALLWVGTILVTIFVGWKLVYWIGTRWLGWKTEAPASAK